MPDLSRGQKARSLDRCRHYSPLRDNWPNRNQLRHCRSPIRKLRALHVFFFPCISLYIYVIEYEMQRAKSHATYVPRTPVVSTVTAVPPATYAKRIFKPRTLRKKKQGAATHNQATHGQRTALKRWRHFSNARSSSR